MRGGQRCDLVERDLVVAHNFHRQRRIDLAKPLHEVVSERIVVVDQEEHEGILLAGRLIAKSRRLRLRIAPVLFNGNIFEDQANCEPNEIASDGPGKFLREFWIIARPTAKRTDYQPRGTTLPDEPKLPSSKHASENCPGQAKHDDIPSGTLRRIVQAQQPAADEAERTKHECPQHLRGSELPCGRWCRMDWAGGGGRGVTHA